MLRLLLDLGARPAGHWQSGHMSPIDANAPDFETPQHEDGRGNTQSRYDYPYGISVNALGLRFFDEGEAQHSYTYAKTGRAVLAQPGARAFQIYDQKGIKLLPLPATIRRRSRKRIRSKSLRRRSALSRRCWCTRSRNSTAPAPTTPTFDSRRPDGKATKGLAIPKSNWAYRIDEPPFRAYR